MRCAGLLARSSLVNFALLIRPDDVSIPVRVELVETLRQAQGERFIVHKAESIV